MNKGKPSMINQTECVNCKFYDQEDDRCIDFECFGIDCPPLPCEIALKEISVDDE